MVTNFLLRLIGLAVFLLVLFSVINYVRVISIPNDSISQEQASFVYAKYLQDNYAFAFLGFSPNASETKCIISKDDIKPVGFFGEKTGNYYNGLGDPIYQINYAKYDNCYQKEISNYINEIGNEPLPLDTVENYFAFFDNPQVVNDPSFQQQVAQIKADGKITAIEILQTNKLYEKLRVNVRYNSLGTVESQK
ncbi:hypothetical protein [Faucicola atlantae]|nr:hypothetical protein [Moraxella atlantae]